LSPISSTKASKVSLLSVSIVIRYKENDYDMVFINHMMQEMDGVDATKKMDAFLPE
jgi:CheY-like chemotaxis protein